MLEYCPQCGTRIQKRTPEETSEIYTMLVKYYELGDGMVWAMPIVKFASYESAMAFKELANTMEHTRWDIGWFTRKANSNND